MRAPSLPRLGDYPAHWARVRPHDNAVVDRGVTTSNAAFEALIDRLAGAMLVAGVRRRDRVAMLATPRLEYLVHFMAAARIGAVWIGLNPRHRLEEFAHVLKDSAPTLLIAMSEIEGRDYRPEIAALRAGPLADTVIVGLDNASDLLPWDAFLERACDRNSLEAAARAVEPDDAALIVYTSGSTGVPKGALISHRAIISSMRIQCEHWWAEPLRVLNNLPINHIGGAVELGCYAIVGGGTNVLMSRFDPVAMPGVLREARVTVLHQVPTMYQLLLDKGRLAPADTASLQALIWSGAPAPAGLITVLRRHCPHLFTAFGMTETCGEILYMPAGASDAELALGVGLPDPAIPIRLGEPDGSGPAKGPSGEIQIRGETCMSGYLGRPEETAAAFTQDGWLRTGDIGEVGPDGLYRISGRLREMYKSGGYNVYPREVEQVIERYPGVAMAAVVGVPDPIYGEIGHAWVLPDAAAGEPAPDAQALEAFCRAHLANYKVPKQFHVRTELPMLPIHKLDKAQLRVWSIAEPA